MTDIRTRFQVQHASSTGRWDRCAWKDYPTDRFDDACAKALQLADRDGKPHRVVRVVSTIEVLFHADTGPGRVLVPPAGYCDRGPCALPAGHHGGCQP